MFNIRIMSPSHVASLDLNDLEALVHFVAEQSVTRAAARLGLSQSGASHLLRRLRARLDDELLVRATRGMAATPRAHRLAGQAARVLAEMQRLRDELEPFEPATLRRSFSLALDDNMALHVVPRLVERLGRLAPGVELNVVRPPERAHDALATSLDLLVDLRQPERPGAFDRLVSTDSFVTVARRGHARVRRALSLEAYLREGHVVVGAALPARSPIDAWLGEQGRARRVAMRLPYFLVALRVASRTDLLLTTSRRLYDAFGAELGLRAFPCPVPLPGLKVYATWHERVHRDTAHAWLREQLIETQKRAAPAAGARAKRADGRAAGADESESRGPFLAP